MNIKNFLCLFLMILSSVVPVSASDSPAAGTGTPATRRFNESRLGILCTTPQASSSPVPALLVGRMAPPTSPYASSPSNQDMDHLRTRLAQLDVIHLESPDTP